MRLSAAWENGWSEWQSERREVACAKVLLRLGKNGEIWGVGVVLWEVIWWSYQVEGKFGG